MAKKKTENLATTAIAAAAPEPAVPRPRLHKLTVRNFRAIGNEPVTLELDDTPPKFQMLWGRSEFAW
jgi:putative ATP-dependent endonuclease of OLD family